MTEEQGDAFQKLGVISTSFSKLEYSMENILARYITNEVYSSTGTVVAQNFQFVKKIEMLQQLTDIKWIRNKEEQLISSLLTECKKLRLDRNRLIHGVWSEPLKGTTGYTIRITQHKIKRNKKEEEKGEFVETRAWNNATSKDYSKADLEKLITTLELVNNLAEQILSSEEFWMNHFLNLK